MNCGDPGDVDNALRIGDNFLFGNNVTYICDDGYYQSSGPEGGLRTCLETGLWSDQQPVCSGMFCYGLTAALWKKFLGYERA